MKSESNERIRYHEGHVILLLVGDPLFKGFYVCQDFSFHPKKLE